MRPTVALSCRGRVTRSGLGGECLALSATNVVSAPLPRCPTAAPRAGFFKKRAGATAMAIISSIAPMVRRSMDQVTGSGNGIEATRMKRMAAGQPASGEPAPAESTVVGNRLQCILGARGSKPAARGEQRREKQLVAANYRRGRPPGYQR